ncbi:FtsW/RodA/SpoVE family cell cycle protein [Companilactobacillus nantensis]|uniref:FtsW/RodA/SpoVE family cell cycle protein n=1 Tax=Companilactobacillus nantensis TaxID=305793 RepID=UPI0007100566|nr:FtsW/RodA/SpoVE family cell cycle protein [Companilactobacillus nantensis]GEO62874.1 cell division protein FtsW [Companilactobacillus nantensis]
MKKLRKIDLWIVIPYILLLGIGIVMVYSASFYNALVVGGKTNQYLVKQALYAVLGLFLCYITFMLKERILKNQRILSFVMIVTLGSLFYLLGRAYLVPSSRVNGASAWINLGFFNFQPLELAKLFLIMFLALVLTNKQNRLLKKQGWREVFREVFQPLVIVGSIIVMVLLQPDIGGALILSLITLVLISSSTIPGRLIAELSGALLVVFTGVIVMITKFPPSFVKHNYAYQRFLAMQHPFQLEQKAGAQLVNSFYAISNGGVFGVGLGNSIQKRGYLPEPHTDFIMSIVSEELGFIGVAFILGLLFIIIMRMISLGFRSKKTYNSLVYYGVATMILAQIILNVGGLLGLIPLTGVTLPFISYGGSSMLVLSVALGVVLNLETTAKFEKMKKG